MSTDTTGILYKYARTWWLIEITTIESSPISRSVNVFIFKYLFCSRGMKPRHQQGTKRQFFYSGEAKPRPREYHAIQAWLTISGYWLPFQRVQIYCKRLSQWSRTTILVTLGKAIPPLFHSHRPKPIIVTAHYDVYSYIKRDFSSSNVSNTGYYRITIYG